MDQPVGNLNFVSVFLRGDGFDVNLAALQASDLLCSLALGEGIQVQELSRSGEFALYSRFGHFFVMLKRLRRAGLQLRCAGSYGIYHRKNRQTQGKGTAAPSHTLSNEHI